MIAYITLINFQSHEKTRVEFHPGVNAIVGLSDSGKTAMLRALTWVVTNRPSGNDFQSNWGGDVLVEVGLTCGTVVSRGYDKKSHFYKLAVPGEEEREFRAMNRDVPPEVRAAFNLTDVNLSGQLDGPYLLADSPGEVAQTLNRVVHLDVIDTAIADIRKKKLDADRSVRDTEDRVVDLEGQLKKYDHLDRLEEDVVELERVESLRDDLRRRGTRLTDLLSRMNLATQQLRSVRTVLRYGPPVEEALELCTKARGLRQRGRRVEELTAEIRRQELRREQARKITAAGPAVEEALSTVARLKVVDDRYNRLNRLCTAIRAKTQEWTTGQNKVVRLQREFDEAFPEVCPLCGKAQ